MAASPPGRGDGRRAALDVLLEECLDLSEGIDPASPLGEEVELARIDLELEPLALCEQLIDQQDRLQQGDVRIVGPVQDQQGRLQPSAVGERLRVRR